jgi:hypothetical protein
MYRALVMGFGAGQGIFALAAPGVLALACSWQLDSGDASFFQANADATGGNGARGGAWTRFDDSGGGAGSAGNGAQGGNDDDARVPDHDAGNDADADGPPANTPPTAEDFELDVIEGTQNNTGRLPASDSDGDPLVYRIEENAAKGNATFTDAAEGKFEYASTSGKSGIDGFTYQVNDGKVDAPQAGKANVLVLPVGPVRVSPIPAPNDVLLGPRAAIDGKTAIVGSFHTSAHGGTAYIARRGPSGDWRLDPEDVLDAGRFDSEVARFGEYVALHDDWALVSAWGDWQDPSPEGMAFFFKRQADGRFLFAHEVTAADAHAVPDDFGGGTLIEGRWAAIGGHGERPFSAGISMFELVDGDHWEFRERILSPVPEIGDFFGQGFDIEGHTLVIGAPKDLQAGVEAGAAHVYHFDGTSWHFQRTLLPSAGGNACEQIALSGDTVICSARFARDHGAAYVFSLSGAIEETIEPPAEFAETTFEFGLPLAFEGDIAVFMTRSTEDVGRGFVYRREATGWEFYRKINTGANSNELFATGVALDDRTILAPSNIEASSVYFFHVPHVGED